MKPFRILFITQEDPFYVYIFFEEFFKNYESLPDIMGVVIAPTMGKKSLKVLAKQMYDFYGPINFVRMGIRYASYKLFDIVMRFIPSKRFFSLKGLCRYYKVPVWFYNNVNSEAFLDEIRRSDLDLIISVAAPQIFKETLITLPRNGCINIHNAKLPKYRGMLPNFWQMYHGERTVGTTIHRIDTGIDEGEILLQKETSLLPGESLDSIIKRTKKAGALFMIEAINGIKNNSLKPLPNPFVESSYFSFPTRSDVMEFKKRGYKLL